MSTTKRILLFGAAALVAAFWLGPDTAVTAEQVVLMGRASRAGLWPWPSRARATPTPPRPA